MSATRERAPDRHGSPTPERAPDRAGGSTRRSAARPAPATPHRPGRRPGSSDTRERILRAARASFGDAGFDGTTIRAIAAAADVDPALVHHYFGSKQRLFVAAMDIPVDMQAALPAVAAGPPGELGERVARFVVDLWDSPAMQPLILGMVRSASTDALAAGMLREVLATGPFLALAMTTDRPDAALRATLVGSQLVGLAMARYIVKVEPLASAPRELLVRALGPTIQRYLAGDLDEADRGTARGAAAEEPKPAPPGF